MNGWRHRNRCNFILENIPKEQVQSKNRSGLAALYHSPVPSHGLTTHHGAQVNREMLKAGIKQ